MCKNRFNQLQLKTNGILHVFIAFLKGFRKLVHLGIKEHRQSKPKKATHLLGVTCDGVAIRCVPCVYCVSYSESACELQYIRALSLLTFRLCVIAEIHKALRAMCTLQKTPA